MPILGSEPTVYPPHLLHSSEGQTGRWWVLHTLPRQEKELARRLHKLQIGFYCPTIARKHRSPAGRLRTTHALLFPSYVFLHGDETARLSALATRCVANCLEVVRQDTFLRELQQVQRLIEAGIDLTPEGQLAPGDSVRIKSGPMQGIIGTVIERRGQKRLLVEVNFIQQGASMEIQDLDLEPYTP